MTLEYTHVKRDIRAVVVDGPDEDDLPDKLRAQGIVTFTPVIRKGDTFQYDGPDGLVTMVPKPIEARISDGIIFHRGREGVKLLAGGADMNPNAVRWRARFEHMQAGGWSFTLRDVTFDAVPGGEVDLTLAAPVAGTPGEGIVRGPSGTSIQDVHVEGAELVITAIDDDGVRELNRIPLDDVVASTAEAAAGRAADGVRQRVKVDADRASGSATQASAAAEQSGADRRQTGEDRAQTGEDREAAAGWAELSEDAAAVAVAASLGLEDKMEEWRFAKHESLPDGTDLDNLFRYKDAGIHRLITDRVYINLPPGVSMAVDATLEVISTGGAGLQRFQQNSSSHIWYRPMTNATTTPRGWGAWRRIDPGSLDSKVEKSYVDDAVDQAFQARSALANGTDLNSLRTSGSQGVWTLGTGRGHRNGPRLTNELPGAVWVSSTGFGDTTQTVIFRWGGGVYQRVETSVGVFTDWQRVDDLPSRMSSLEGDVQNLAESPAAVGSPIATTWETSRMLTSYEEGEAYLTALAERSAMVRKVRVGETRTGLPLSAIIAGDENKPAVVITAGVHGNEPGGREAALSWLKPVARDWPSWMDHVCVVVMPTVNAEMINVRRLTSNGTDINRNWDSRTREEIHAIINLIEMVDARVYIDAHEGGAWVPCEIVGSTDQYVDPDVAAQAQLIENAASSALAERDLPAAVYPVWEQYDHEMVQAMGWHAVARTMNIPSLLVETPTSTAGDWQGPGPHKNYYLKPLDERIAMQQACFDGVISYVASNLSSFPRLGG